MKHKIVNYDDKYAGEKDLCINKYYKKNLFKLIKKIFTKKKQWI